MNDIDKKQKDKIESDKRQRAKRSDIDAMQERFDAILTVLRTVTWYGDEMPTPAANAAELIGRLAEGACLDEIVQEAGLRALGLEPPVSEGS